MHTLSTGQISLCIAFFCLIDQINIPKVLTLKEWQEFNLLIGKIFNYFSLGLDFELCISFYIE